MTLRPKTDILHALMIAARGEDPISEGRYLTLAEFLTFDDMKDAAREGFTVDGWDPPMFAYTGAGARDAVQRSLWALDRARAGLSKRGTARGMGNLSAALWVAGEDALSARCQSLGDADALAAFSAEITAWLATASPEASPSVAVPGHPPSTG